MLRTKHQVPTKRLDRDCDEVESEGAGHPSELTPPYALKDLTQIGPPQYDRQNGNSDQANQPLHREIVCQRSARINKCETL
jgi:hypothetical protein